MPNEIISEIRLSRRSLLLMAFVSGMAVMVMEISAARLLAPYFGTSMYIWTNVIGIVLIALSIGYYLGGRLADRKPDPKILLSVIAIAGTLGLAIPWVVRPIASYLTLDVLIAHTGMLFIFIASFLASLVIFAIPVCLLGMVSPFIIRLYATDHHVGESAGSVFAVGTIGSIIGTYLPTLWLIPTFGTNATISMAGAALVIIATWGWLRSKRARLLILLLVCGVTSLSSTLGIRATAATVYEGESEYQYIRVDQAPDGIRVLKFNEGLGVQSILPIGGMLTGYYYDYYQTLPLFFENKKELNVLIVGLAGGTISRQLYGLYGDRIQIDGVEIDGKVIDVAKKYFDMTRPNLTIYQEDGIVYLTRTKKKYDIIIVDAYRDQLYIPWTMTTSEFWKLVSTRLSPDGLVAMNVNGGSRSLLVRAVVNTQAGIVHNVYTVPITHADMNMMIIGSYRTLDPSILRDASPADGLRPIMDNVVQGMSLVTYDPEGIVLTNDTAPVEFLTDSTIFGSR